ncbi:MAG: GNAT family N-acetyltransferase [Clostridiaceae bacterium]|nr:GNAT family N-acetyltransferase [Clostridiaceae bacterium]
MLVIKHLSECKEHMDLVTHWLWREWGNEKNYRSYKSIIENSLSEDNLPQTFVALIDDKPVGTVGLWRCDLMSRQDLYPWLASLYVEPDYRGQGIGTKLQNFLVEHSKELGYEEIFLYTELMDYYEKTGWEYIGDSITPKGEEVRMYKIQTGKR